MAKDKRAAALKEIQEAKKAMQEYAKHLYYKIRHCITCKIRRAKEYILIVCYCTLNYMLRGMGACLKLPVYLLNTVSIYGNLLQVHANKYKGRANSLMYIDRDVKSDDE